MSYVEFLFYLRVHSVHVSWYSLVGGVNIWDENAPFLQLSQWGLVATQVDKQMDQVVYMINKEIIEYHFKTGWRTSVYKNVVEIKNEDIKVEAENDL